jgi:hypothetical protein
MKWIKLLEWNIYFLDVNVVLKLELNVKRPFGGHQISS